MLTTGQLYSQKSVYLQIFHDLENGDKIRCFSVFHSAYYCMIFNKISRGMLPINGVKFSFVECKPFLQSYLTELFLEIQST